MLPTWESPRDYGVKLNHLALCDSPIAPNGEIRLHLQCKYRLVTITFECPSLSRSLCSGSPSSMAREADVCLRT